MTDPVMLLSQVHGEGRVTFRALRTAGFETLSSVAEAPVQTLSELAHLSMQTARRLKAGAEDMIGKGIGLQGHPEPEQAARRPRAARALRAAEAGVAEEARAPRRFSEGISLEEAALLGQGIEVLLFEESILEIETADLPPAGLGAVLDGLPEPSPHAQAIATAAGLAASLPRVADASLGNGRTASPPAGGTASPSTLGAPGFQSGSAATVDHPVDAAADVTGEGSGGSGPGRDCANLRITMDSFWFFG